MKVRTAVISGEWVVALGVGAAVILVPHPGSTSAPVLVAKQVVVISGSASVVGGPMKPGATAAPTHGFSGVVAVYPDPSATGKPAATASVTPDNDSYRFTLDKSGTYYVVAETPQGFKQAAVSPVTARLGEHKVVDVQVDVP